MPEIDVIFEMICLKNKIKIDNFILTTVSDKFSQECITHAQRTKTQSGECLFSLGSVFSPSFLFSQMRSLVSI